MDREEQTKRIGMMIAAAVVVLIAAYAVFESKKDYEKRYPGCWQLIGHDAACEAAVAAERIRTGY